MELKDIISWKSVDELPMDNPYYKKVLILSEGRISGRTSLCVSTDYWQVFLDERDFGEEQFYDKKEKLNNQYYAYGRFGERKIPLDKIKGWMFANDLIKLYNERG
jgi:hypothetical protein